MRPIFRWALILLSLVFLCAGVFSGGALAVHTGQCCECAQPAGSTGCPVFLTLRAIFQKLAGALVLGSGLVVGLVLSPMSVGTASLAERQHAPSLVGWNVKFSC